MGYCWTRKVRFSHELSHLCILCIYVSVYKSVFCFNVWNLGFICRIYLYTPSYEILKLEVFFFFFFFQGLRTLRSDYLLFFLPKISIYHIFLGFISSSFSKVLITYIHFPITLPLFQNSRSFCIRD